MAGWLTAGLLTAATQACREERTTTAKASAWQAPEVGSLVRWLVARPPPLPGCPQESVVPPPATSWSEVGGPASVSCGLGVTTDDPSGLPIGTLAARVMLPTLAPGGRHHRRYLLTTPPKRAQCPSRARLQRLARRHAPCCVSCAATARVDSLLAPAVAVCGSPPRLTRGCAQADFGRPACRPAGPRLSACRRSGACARAGARSPALPPPSSRCCSSRATNARPRCSTQRRGGNGAPVSST